MTVTSDDAGATSAALGMVLPRPGTGTIEITDMAVQINTPRDFNIKYTAATRIEDAYLVVQIPGGDTLDTRAFLMPDVADDTQLIPLTLTDANHPDPANRCG